MTPAQFDAIFRASLGEITRFIARRVAQSEIEDIAAELFALAWSKHESIPEGMELPWLYKTARYLIANHHRKANNRTRIFSRLNPPTSAPSAESIAISDLELADGWRKLSSAERDILALSAFEGLTPKEIAVALEISANAVGIRLHRARVKLAALLELKEN